MRDQNLKDLSPPFRILLGTVVEETIMGKVLVLYDSVSGNTAKMARLVAEGAESIAGMEVRPRMVEQATPEDVLWCDGLALGSPTNMGLWSRWRVRPA